VNRTIASRVRRLEQDQPVLRERVHDQIQTEAFRALTDQDLDALHAFLKRNETSLSGEFTPEEQAAAERYHVAAEAAALRITGRPLANLRAEGR
jgi:hypothetical protein